MKHRATAAVLATVAALAALTACSSSSDSHTDKPSPAPTKSSAAADPFKAAGIPPKPSGKIRTELLAALRKVGPALVADPDKAIDNARNQCSAINGKAPKVDWSAQQRFSSSAHQVTAAEAKQINAALAAYCATA
jgi:hypothetical protein